MTSRVLLDELRKKGALSDSGIVEVARHRGQEVGLGRSIPTSFVTPRPTTG